MGAFATPICRENSLSPVLRGSFLGVLETGDEARRSLHMVLQRGGQFLAGHTRLQLGRFWVEISRHERPGVMVPIGVERRARPEIEPRSHQVLAADELRRFLAELALGKALHIGGNAVDHHVRYAGRRTPLGVEQQRRWSGESVWPC